MIQRKAGNREVLYSVYSVIALVFILVACVELCNAATVFDVYRLIQYDMSGSSFESRLATLNHHAASMHFPPGAGLSRTRHIYGHQGKNIQVFADNSSLTVNPSYVRSWLDLLLRTPRVAPFLSKNDPLIMALKNVQELADHTDEVTLQHEVLEGMFTFYDSIRARLSICQVASVTFDLLLLLVLGSYLTVLFSFLVITTRGFDDLISVFRRPPRKLKMA